LLEVADQRLAVESLAWLPAQRPQDFAAASSQYERMELLLKGWQQTRQQHHEPLWKEQLLPKVS
jgi:hypothetical protein